MPCSYQLVRHPAALKRLREEVMSFTKDQVKLTRAHIAKMDYLTCVLNESEYSINQSMLKCYIIDVWKPTDCTPKFR